MPTPRPFRDGVRHGLQLMAAIAELPTSWMPDPVPQARVHGRAHLGQAHGVWLLDCAGGPQRMGEAGGTLLARPTRRLMQLMRCSPGVLLSRFGRRSTQLSDAIPAAYREEALCWARAAGCDGEALLRCNTVADACCTAVVIGPQPGAPLTIGRNLDFFPAGALGRATVVALLRRDGVRPIASVTWPGFNGVLSGINATGLSGCVLLNFSIPSSHTGMPIAYRVREILETASSCEEAVQRFSEVPVASSHYLLLADATTASVVWHERGEMRRHDLRHGWLSCSNGARSPQGLAIDDRGRHLDRLSRAGEHDDAWMRSTITSTYLPGINAQSMVIIPQRCELQLALGDAYHPAALNRWVVLPLQEAFDGAPLTTLALGLRERERPLQHYARRAS
jgi:hypothetical protein